MKIPELLEVLRPAVGIHRDNSRDLLAFSPWANLHAQFGSGIDSVMPSRLQYRHVQEHVAGAVGQLNEAKALVRIEPLDDGVYRRAAWGTILART